MFPFPSVPFRVLFFVDPHPNQFALSICPCCLPFDVLRLADLRRDVPLGEAGKSAQWTACELRAARSHMAPKGTETASSQESNTHERHTLRACPCVPEMFAVPFRSEAHTWGVTTARGGVSETTGESGSRGSGRQGFPAVPVRERHIGSKQVLACITWT